MVGTAERRGSGRTGKAVTLTSMDIYFVSLLTHTQSDFISTAISFYWPLGIRVPTLSD